MATTDVSSTERAESSYVYDKLPATESFQCPFGPPGFLKNYHGCLVPHPFWETLPEVETFETRRGDVVIVTFPKSGTGLTSAVVHMMQNNVDPECLKTGLLEQKIPYMEWCSPDMPVGKRPIDLIKDQKPPRTFDTHLSYSALPKSILKHAKIIYVTRNPKDTIVSMHNIARAATSYNYALTLEESFETFVNNTCIYSPFFEHVADFWNQRKDHSNIFFATFEGFLKNFKSVCKEPGYFLGKHLTEKELDTMMCHCNFDVMKTNNCVHRRAWANTGVWDFNISPYMRADLNKRVDEWITSEECRLKDKLQLFKFEYTM